MAGARKIKICFVGWGDHVHLERWAGYFPKLGYDVSVISFSGFGHYPDEVAQFSLESIPLKSHKLRMLYLKYLLWKLKPDIVHAHYAGFLLPITKVWRGTLVLTAWGSDIYRMESISETDRAQLIGLLATPDMITCDSNDLAEKIQYLSKIRPNKVQVIQWGVDTNVFAPSTEEASIKAELGISGQPVVISPRSFLPLYRIIEIIKAFHKVVALVPNAVLLLKRYNQDDNYNDEILNLVRELGLSEQVIILDRVEYHQMADFYRAGDVMVSIPETDGTPMSLLESMACGCPPVVSDVLSVKEWVTHGVNGLVVSGDDIDTLAAAIVSLLMDKEKSNHIVTENLTLVKSKASQDVNMQRMSELYKQLVS